MYNQFMSKALQSAKGRSLIGKCYISRKFGKTHYDTLQLPTTCTAKEIKEAFIKLSKTCHPDCNQDDPGTHAQFVKLNEAYQVLSRPETRRDYDLSLLYVPPRRPHEDIHYTTQQEKETWDQSFWEKRDRSKDRRRDEDNYYGVKGVRRIPSIWIGVLLVALSAFGTAIQLASLHLYLRSSGLTFSREQLNERNRQASMALADLRARNEHLTKEERLENIKKQLANDSFKSVSESSTQ